MNITVFNAVANCRMHPYPIRNPRIREEKHNTSNFSPSIIDTVLSDNSNAGDAVVSKKFYIGVLAATVFLPIIGIIMGIIYLLKDHPEEKKAGKMWLIVGIGIGVLNAILLSMGN